MDWEAFYNNFRSPDFIPGYEIQNRLGGGAFGDVYKARKRSIGKAYAIKFLKVEDESQREAVERELDQVRHFAAIDHPNLVTIEDLGTVMDVPYLIMGYAGEDTLARRLKQGPLDRESALLYFVQVCRGVLALHDRRLVHFDLKPSNVFLKGEVARVGDYGLSKLLVDGRMTLSFGRGTPQYMAPEMLRSRADHRADIYSLGVILFESLAGRLPFEPAPEGGLVLREEDRPPEFDPTFPAVLRPAVERCLRLDPKDRYADVGELLTALGQSARQGDSVRLELGELPAPAATQARSGANAATAEPAGVSPEGAGSSSRPTPRPSSELRRTASHLARGAALVARGVWDGLRSGQEGEEPPPPPPPPVDGQLSPRATALRRELAAARRADPATPPVTAGEGTVATAVASAAPSGEMRPGPVPVPPRVEGGLLGTTVQTLVVGIEVLLALVRGLFHGLVSAFRGLVQGLLGGTGGLVRRLVGWAGFLLLMATLGFVVMLVGMAFVQATGIGT